MSTTQIAPVHRRFALPAVALFAITWNLYGVVQFIRSLGTAPDMGMTSYPAWMTAAFALGVFGGLVGSVLLLGRRGVAVPVFGASLAGYVALFIGDITEGVFAALGASQVVVLGMVVAIAAFLYAWSRRLRQRAVLR